MDHFLTCFSLIAYFHRSPKLRGSRIWWCCKWILRWDCRSPHLWALQPIYWKALARFPQKVIQMKTVPFNQKVFGGSHVPLAMASVLNNTAANCTLSRMPWVVYRLHIGIQHLFLAVSCSLSEPRHFSSSHLMDYSLLMIMGSTSRFDFIIMSNISYESDGLRVQKDGEMLIFLIISEFLLKNKLL